MSELVAERGGPGLAGLSGRLHQTPRLACRRTVPAWAISALAPGPARPDCPPRPGTQGLPGHGAPGDARLRPPLASSRGVVSIGASVVGQTRQSSSTRLSIARSAATASPSALNSSSVMPGRRRTVNTTSDPLSSAITLIGT
jgi:hypothetical protein